ncbi:prenyltransferase/squalene oxidase repeat-containing protein [Thermodesulfitimonas autotrophica]|uniref:prenyltransferase/squalene oxidase repeat-containing protein n=1 Tax=Thermodesulfitimonas autotrophica TaxID=1894989 RepID=UPI002FDFB696
MALTEARELINRTAAYIESCRVEGDGYYFARIPPGSPHDTFYAVATLRLLDTAPRDPEGVAVFFQELFDRGALATPPAIYYAVETLALLGKLTPAWQRLGEKLRSLQEPAGGFWVPQTLWVEAASRLENTLYAVGALTRLGTPFAAAACASFVTRELSAALTKGGLPSLATIHDAVAILALLGQPVPDSAALHAYLHDLCRQEPGFLEYWYYIVVTLQRLGHRPPNPERITAFVMACERARGGFARSPSPCAIPTIRDTFHAAAVLRNLDALPGGARKL